MVVACYAAQWYWTAINVVLRLLVVFVRLDILYQEAVAFPVQIIMQTVSTVMLNNAPIAWQDIILTITNSAKPIAVWLTAFLAKTETIVNAAAAKQAIYWLIIHALSLTVLPLYNLME